MRTTLNLDDRVLRRTKKLAAQTHRTLSSVVEDALCEVLNRAHSSRRRKRIRLPVSRRRPGLLPGVHLDDSAGLLETMERHRTSV